ncbi:MAG: VCBS repeat-containing protein, partial [Bacteroidota bacterium]|nr:VCBS repeat-containing protein [Bacteroidota bacterium]
KYGLGETGGMWCKIITDDIDGDGDLDIVAGNVGLNTQFKASVSEPVGICYSDFDNNGSVDPLLCYYIQGKNYPYASLDELAEQLPVMRKKFLRYENYSNATFDQLFTPEQMKKAITLKATQLASCYFENRNGKFIARQLPVEAQFSALMGIVAGDWNKDGKKDLLITGNYYPWRVQLGRMDANRGWLLQGDGKGSFKVLYPQQSGFTMQGDVRDMIMVSTKQYPLFIAARNNDLLLVVKKK